MTPPMLIDTHCHLASARFDEQERGEVIGRALGAGIGGMVTLATCLEDLQANLELAKHPAVHAAIGIHPCDVHEAPDDAVAQLTTPAADPRVCAIGETGLDYFHPAPEGWTDGALRERQREFLRRHFELAAGCGLNVVIHTRDRSGSASFEDALEIYRTHHGSVRAVFHCFIGTWEQARRVLDLGGLVSFGGITTFDKSGIVPDCARRCPAGSFMLETDSPYLAPAPHRGKRNEPAHLALIAEHLAALRGETRDELARHCEGTARSFFRFRSSNS